MYLIKISELKSELIYEYFYKTVIFHLYYKSVLFTNFRDLEKSN